MNPVLFIEALAYLLVTALELGISLSSILDKTIEKVPEDKRQQIIEDLKQSRLAWDEAPGPEGR